MATAPALYFNTSTGRSTRFANSDTLQTNTIDAFAATDSPSIFDTVTTGTITIGDGVTSGSVTIGANMTAGSTVTIGAANTTTTFPGDVQIDGTETVTTSETVEGTLNVEGKTTLEGDVDLGDPAGGNDTVTLKGYLTGPSQNIIIGPNTGGSTHTITTTDSSGTDLVVTAGTAQSLTLTTPTAATWSSTAGALTLTSAAAATWSTGAGRLTLDGAAGVTVDSNSAALNLSTDGANDINMTPGSGVVAVTTTGTNQALTLDTGGSTASVGIYAADGVPGTLANNPGSLYLDTANGNVYVGSGGNSWAQLTTGGSLTLQDVYSNSDDPATITTTATKEILLEDNNNDGFLFLDPVNHRVDIGANGGTNDNDIRLLGEVADDITFENTAARAVEIDAQALTVQTTNSGLLTLAGAGGITNTSTGGTYTVNAAGQTVDINSTAFDVDATAGNISLTTNTSGNVALNAAGTADIDGAAVTIDSSGASGIVIKSADLSGGDIEIKASEAAGTAGITVASGGGNLLLQAGAANPGGDFLLYGYGGSGNEVRSQAANLLFSIADSGVMSFDNEGDNTTYRKIFDMTNNEGDPGSGGADVTTDVLVSSNNPNTGEGSGTAASLGSICLVNDGSTIGALYVKTGTSATTGWEEVQTGTDTITLQAAYDNQVGSGADPVELDTVDWQVNIDDDAANWVVSNEAGTANYVATNYTNNALELGSSGGKEVHFLGTVGTDIDFDGAAGRSISQSGTAQTLTVENTGTGASHLILQTTGGTDADVDINSSGSIWLDAEEDSSFNVNSGNVTLNTTGSGNVQLNAATNITGLAPEAIIFASSGSTALHGVRITTDETTYTSNGWSIDALGAAAGIADNGSNLSLSTTGGGEIDLTSSGAVDINASTGGTTIDGTSFTVGGTAAIPITLTGTTVDVDGTGAVSINSSAAAINVGNDDVDQAINIGTQGERTITVGNGATGAAAVNITAGTTGNITFDALDCTSPLTYNQSGDLDLDGFTATSVVGALNELKAASSDVTTTVTAGETLTKGDVVYLDTTDNSEAKKADASASASAVVLGIAAEGITDNTTGDVALVGDVVVNTDLSGDTVGDVVYLGATGEVTTTIPTSNTYLRLGVITVAGTAGTARIALNIGEPVDL